MKNLYLVSCLNMYDEEMYTLISADSAEEAKAEIEAEGHTNVVVEWEKKGEELKQ